MARSKNLRIDHLDAKRPSRGVRWCRCSGPIRLGDRDFQDRLPNSSNVWENPSRPSLALSLYSSSARVLYVPPELKQAIKSHRAWATAPGSQAEAVGSSSHLTPRWSKPDSNLYGAFPVKWLFWVLLRVLCSERESRSSSRRLRSGSRSARKGSRDRNGSIAWRLAA